MTLAAERLLEDDPPPGPVVLAAPPDWPAPPGPAVSHGLIGEIIRTLEPETEADPVAILTQLLVAFGTAVGRGAYFQIEATRHHPHEFLLLVGESSRARKGSSWDHVRRVICEADPTPHGRILTGLSSGEGLVWAVRDPAESDPGIGDRRLLALEPEFVSVLKSAGREISTLSPTLRSAWDGRPLQLLTRTAPARSTDAHISLIGHITQAELRHHLTQVELANGLANRFLLCACRRTRLLPEGGHSDPLAGTGLTRSAARSDTPAPPGAYACTSKHANYGATPTPSSQPPSPLGSPARSAHAQKRTPSVSRSSTHSPTANARSRPSTSKPRSRSGTTQPAPPTGRCKAPPATRSPSRSTPRCKPIPAA